MAPFAARAAEEREARIRARSSRSVADWTITTRERDLTDRTILALRRPDVRTRPTHESRSRRSPVEPVHPTSDSPWTRMRESPRRAQARCGIAAGGVVAPLLAACAAPDGAPRLVRPCRQRAASPTRQRRRCPVPITVLRRRRRSEHRAGAAAGLRRLQGPAPRHRVGHPGAPGPAAPSGTGSRAPRWSPASRSGS